MMVIRRSQSGLIRRASRASVRYSAVAALTCPLGKLAVGGARSSSVTAGRLRPTRVESVSKITNWSRTARAGDGSEAPVAGPQEEQR